MPMSFKKNLTDDLASKFLLNFNAPGSQVFFYTWEFGSKEKQ